MTDDGATGQGGSPEVDVAVLAVAGPVLLNQVLHEVERHHALGCRRKWAREPATGRWVLPSWFVCGWSAKPISVQQGVAGGSSSSSLAAAAAGGGTGGKANLPIPAPSSTSRSPSTDPSSLSTCTEGRGPGRLGRPGKCV